jgi:hypothetical protein
MRGLSAGTNGASISKLLGEFLSIKQVDAEPRFRAHRARRPLYEHISLLHNIEALPSFPRE